MQGEAKSSSILLKSQFNIKKRIFVKIEILKITARFLARIFHNQSFKKKKECKN